MSERNEDDKEPAPRKGDGGASRTQIIVALIGAAAILTATIIGNADRLWQLITTNTKPSPSPAAPATPTPTPTLTPAAKPKVIIMDNNLLTYREDERSKPSGRTNHDDIEDALRDLNLPPPATINTNLDWLKEPDNFRKLKDAKPDLIIIHASAFSEVTINPEKTDDNFRTFIRGAMNDLLSTRLLVYSRAFEAVSRAEIMQYASSMPGLKDRTYFFHAKPGHTGQYFKDPEVSQGLRAEVKKILQLP